MSETTKREYAQELYTRYKKYREVITLFPQEDPENYEAWLEHECQLLASDKTALRAENEALKGELAHRNEALWYLATTGEYNWSLVYHFGDPAYGWEEEADENSLNQELIARIEWMGKVAKAAREGRPFDHASLYPPIDAVPTGKRDALLGDDIPAKIQALIDADTDNEYMVIRVRKGVLTRHETGVMKEAATQVGLVIKGRGFTPDTLRGKVTADFQWDEQERVDWMRFDVMLDCGYHTDALQQAQPNEPTPAPTAGE